MDPTELATVQRSLTAPPPNDPRKPAWPWQLSGRAWRHALRRTPASLLHHDGFDSAAGLAYFSVLSLFPGLLALLSTLSLFGYGEQTVAVLLGTLGRYAPAAIVDLVSEPIAHLTSVAGAGWVFVGALVVAVWSASGYVAAFGRALNRIYDVVEGRPLWEIVPYNLGLTVALLVFGAASVVAVALSADAVVLVTSYLHVPTEWLVSLQATRWPWLVAGALLLAVALYHATPNVRMPHLGWTTVGALVAVAAWLSGFAGFSWWVSAVPQIPATYGVIGSFIVLMLGLYVMNLALLLGAELNAELERVRELAAGLHAEDVLLLPPRRTRMIHARERQQGRHIREAIHLRVDQLLATSPASPDGGDGPPGPSAIDGSE